MRKNLSLSGTKWLPIMTYIHPPDYISNECKNLSLSGTKWLPIMTYIHPPDNANFISQKIFLFIFYFRSLRFIYLKTTYFNDYLVVHVLLKSVN
jgi:hypothetical protein